MTGEQIRQIVDNLAYPDAGKHPVVAETHISWVIIGRNYAFKIKKPVKFSFLDFSTLEKRAHYCHTELRLNRRLTSGVYLDVIPVSEVNGKAVIGGADGKVIDYALRMRKLRNSLRLDHVIQQKKPIKEKMEMLAIEVARFHKETDIIRQTFDPDAHRHIFNDLKSVEGIVESMEGKEKALLIDRFIACSDRFLATHVELMRRRQAEGFVRDCHGDLHAKNIFLYQKPVIFDCIEFNEEFRHIDVLNEIAFFMMDMDNHGRPDLGKRFLTAYLKRFPCIRNEEEEKLLLYYQLYRANVKAKVSAFKAAAPEANEAERNKRQLHMRNYLGLMERYVGLVEG